MMEWRHLLCEQCWRVRSPNHEPHRVLMTQPKPCCDCELLTKSGIYFRVFPENMPCKGKRGIHADDPVPEAA